MSVTCSTCGKQSQDPEFCDHCNADLGKSGQSLPPEHCPLTEAGAALTTEQRHALLFPEASIPLEADGRTWRVHWLSARDWREREPQIERRLELQLTALPAGRVVDDSDGRWLAFETATGITPVWLHPPLDDPLA